MTARARPLDPATVDLDTWLASSKALAAARAKSARAADTRAALPPGSTRARVTTANARWARAAEEAHRIEMALRDQWDAAHLARLVAAAEEAAP